MVIYGCISGKSPLVNWQQWVFRGLQVQDMPLRSQHIQSSMLVSAPVLQLQ